MEPGLPWRLIVTGGSIVLGSPQADEAPLVLNRILMRALLDPAKKRIDLLQGDVGGGGVNLAMSGNIDFLLRRAAIVRRHGRNADERQASPSASGRFSSPPRCGPWVLDNIQGGDVSRIEIAANAPMPTLKEDGPPIPR
jgi:hypothetical protein